MTFPPRRNLRLKLIAAWHGGHSAAALGRKLGLGAAARVQAMFRELQRRGDLPPGPRPGSPRKRPPSTRATPIAAVTPPPPPSTTTAVLEVWDIDPEIERDFASEIALPWSGDPAADPPARVPARDPLLAALRRAHGRDPRRRFDRYLDAASLDRKHSSSPGFVRARLFEIDRHLAALTPPREHFGRGENARRSCQD